MFIHWISLHLVGYKHPLTNLAKASQEKHGLQPL
jgi:hypothetical protein